MTAPSWSELLDRIRWLCYSSYRSWKKSRRRARIAKLQSKRVYIGGSLLNLEPGTPIPIPRKWNGPTVREYAEAYKKASARIEGRQVTMNDLAAESAPIRIHRSREPVPIWTTLNEE